MNIKMATLLLLIVSPLSYAETSPWYAGITIGSTDSDRDLVGEPNEKYGLRGGYQFNNWLAAESELIMHGSESDRLCDSSEYSNACVTLKQDYNYALIGLRATKHIGRVFGFTGRLGGAMVNYDSNMESSESRFNISPSLGILWRIKDSTITFEAQQIDYPIANKRHEKLLSANLSFTMKF